MNKLVKIIQGLGKKELALIEKDLQEGNIERLIAQRRKQLSGPQETVCPTCGMSVDKHADLALEFGPKDFRKRAVFDAPDCLTYFLEEKLQTTHEKR